MESLPKDTELSLSISDEVTAVIEDNDSENHSSSSEEDR
jgi:hypothetical protein